MKSLESHIKSKGKGELFKDKSELELKRLFEDLGNNSSDESLMKGNRNGN